MTDANPPLSRVVRRAEVPEDGLKLEIAADASEREALAGFLDILAVEMLRAEMTVERWRADGLVVRGTLEAEVEQACVVTLEPVRGAVQEHFEDYFLPDPETLRGSALIGPDPVDVEPLIDQRIDVAALAVEHLVLGLDPYPRREGVAFEMAEDRADEGRPNPFAALAGLRGRGKPR